MKIKFEKTDEQLDLVKKMGSSNKSESLEAQEAFASLLAPRIGEVIQQADTTAFLYRTIDFNDGDLNPTFPVSLFTDEEQDHYSVWSQGTAGGLPTNHIYESIQEVAFLTYRLDSAVSYLKKYASNVRLDVIAKAIERLMQEVLVKTNTTAWSPLLAALASASHNGLSHVYRTVTADKVTLEDVNKMLTKFKRITASWAGGTPVGGASRPTDIILSPESMEQFRAMSYNPINSADTLGSAGGAVELPDSEKMAIFNSAGNPEFFGLGLVELNELGEGQAYNVLFDNYQSGSIDKVNGTAGASFTGTTDDLLIFVDASKDFAFRALGQNDYYKSSFVLQPDDQFFSRSEKIGMYGYVTEGRIVTSTRHIMGLVR